MPTPLRIRGIRSFDAWGGDTATCIVWIQEPGAHQSWGAAAVAPPSAFSARRTIRPRLSGNEARPGVAYRRPGLGEPPARKPPVELFLLPNAADRRAVKGMHGAVVVGDEDSVRPGVPRGRNPAPMEVAACPRSKQATRPWKAAAQTWRPSTTGGRPCRQPGRVRWPLWAGPPCLPDRPSVIERQGDQLPGSPKT